MTNFFILFHRMIIIIIVVVIIIALIIIIIIHVSSRTLIQTKSATTMTTTHPLPHALTYLHNRQKLLKILHRDVGIIGNRPVALLYVVLKV
jgi:hypothetical protein